MSAPLTGDVRKCLLRSQETYESSLSTAAAANLSLSVLAAGWVGIVEADNPTSGTNCSVQGQTLKVTKDGCLHSFIHSPNKSPHQPAHHWE